MSTRKHLRELQWRLLIVVAFFAIGAVAAYAFRDTIIPLLMAPLHGERLIYLNPAGGFSFIFLVAVYAGIAFAFPVLLHQMYSFLRPALPVTAHRKSGRIILASFALLVAGVAFGYFVAVPNALTFLYSFADAYIDAALTAESYLSFIVAYTVGVGIVFQVPLLLLLIHAIKPLTPGGLMKSEKWVVLVAFVVAAIITPTPDPVNQTIIAVPVITVYQLGVGAVLWSIASSRRRARREAKRSAVIAPSFASAPTPAPTVASVHRPAQTMRTVDGVRRARPSVARSAPTLASTPVARQHHAPALAPSSLTPRNATFSMDGVRPIRRVSGY